MFRAASIIFTRQSCFMKYRFCPPCITCKHIILDEWEPLNKMKMRCGKFAVSCRLTGVIEYEHAIKCRNDVKKCADIGFYYESRKLGP